MNEIEIYVKTSALGGDGIHWRNVSKPEQPREIPPILNPEAKENRIVLRTIGGFSTVEPLVIDTKPCILLVRHKGELFLEITGIEATPERSNQLGRSIYDVIAWVADDNETNEEIFRKLAAKALLDFWSDDDTGFLNTIKTSIKFSGKDGFIIEDISSIQLTDRIQSSVDNDLQDIDNIWNRSDEINPDSKKLSNQILSDLFPEQISPLVFTIKKGEKGVHYFKHLLDKDEAISEDSFTPADETIDSSTGVTSPAVIDSCEKKTQLQIIFVLGIIVGLMMGLIIAVVFMNAKIPLMNQIRQSAIVNHI